MEDRELCTLQERVGSLRTHLEMKEMNEEEWEDERACNNLKKKWLRDYPGVFKEDLDINDRIEMEPVEVDLVENHQDSSDADAEAEAEADLFQWKRTRKQLNLTASAS